MNAPRHLQGYPLDLLEREGRIGITEAVTFWTSVPQLLIHETGPRYRATLLTWAECDGCQIRAFGWKPRGTSSAITSVIGETRIAMDLPGALQLLDLPGLAPFELRHELNPPAFFCTVQSHAGNVVRLRELCVWLEREPGVYG